MGIRSAAAFFLTATVLASVFARPLPGAEVPSWAKVSPEQVAAAKKLGVPVAMEDSVGMRFVLIPAGTFMMGSRDSALEVAGRCNMPNAQAGWFYDEHPQHKVTLSGAFYMSIHEVTQACYATVTQPKPSKDGKKFTDNYPDGFQGANSPVLNISWDDTQKFCKALSKGEGREYFLPTEAQWEYVCRAGTETPFSFGETISTDQANYHGDYTYGDGKKGEYREKPLPVGSLAPNAWGLYDMHGNVSEWCAGWYDKYTSDAETNPQGPEKGKERVLRGASWRSYPGACRSAFRLGSGGRPNSNNVGFRVCCAVATEADSKEGPKKP